MKTLEKMFLTIQQWDELSRIQTKSIDHANKIADKVFKIEKEKEIKRLWKLSKILPKE